MDIYLSEDDFLDLLTVLVAYGRSAKDTEQARIEGLIGRVFLNARGKVETTNTESVKTNGGVTCDMTHGPCACGAWHEPRWEDQERSGDIKDLRDEFRARLKPTITYAAPNGIVRVLGPTDYFKVFVRCQDGIEFYGDCKSLDEARTTWASGSIQMGNKNAKPSDAKLYEFEDGKYIEKECK